MSDTLTKILYKPIAKDLDQVLDIMKSSLKKERVTSIREVNVYVAEGQGKRLRPLMALLSAFTVNPGLRDDRVRYRALLECAAAIELIHNASLVHDDILDNAEVRHDRPSIVAKWGQNVAIPTGVYLYAISLDKLVQTGSLDVIRIISNVVKKLCSGELTQVMNRYQWLSVEDYLIMVKKKTSVLFSAASYCGAILAGASKQEQFALKHFGHFMGLAYQIYDDVLDLAGSKDVLLKNALQDLVLGEYTLPLIEFRNMLSADDRGRFDSKILTKDAEQIVSFLIDHPSYEAALLKTWNRAEFYLNKARETLNHFPSSEYKKTQESILDLIKKRSEKAFKSSLNKSIN